MGLQHEPLPYFTRSSAIEDLTHAKHLKPDLQQYIAHHQVIAEDFERRNSEQITVFNLRSAEAYRLYYQLTNILWNKATTFSLAELLHNGQLDQSLYDWLLGEIGEQYGDPNEILSVFFACISNFCGVSYVAQLSAEQRITLEQQAFERLYNAAESYIPESTKVLDGTTIETSVTLHEQSEQLHVFKRAAQTREDAVVNRTGEFKPFTGVLHNIGDIELTVGAQVHELLFPIARSLR